MKIFMIADDSPVIRKVVRRLLEDMMFVVVEASSADEALAMARNNMPDAIMMDWEMPGISSVEAIGEIMRLPDAEATKILYCTSEIMVSDMTRAKRAGAHGFVMKPFTRAILERKFMETGIIEANQAAA